MNDGWSGVVPSAAILGIAAAAALYLTLTRRWAGVGATEFRGTARMAALAIVLQAGHFIEELLTGLPERLPALFGRAPMPLSIFVSFNAVWLVIWSLSAWGLVKRIRAALFPLWFLGIGCAGNGIAHPLLSVLSGGYFPGLATSLVVGVAGLLLLRRLILVTAGTGSS